MRISAMWVVAWVALACASGSGPPQLDEDAAPDAALPWTRLPVHDAPEDFHFVVVTDRTGEHRPGVFRASLEKLNLLQPAFVLSVGDLIEGYTEDRAELDRQWSEIASMVDVLEMPFVYLPGNHDMSNAPMAEVWQQRFGTPWYQFRYKDVLFLGLNSELFSMVSRPGRPVPGAFTQEEQLAFAERVLADNADARWTVVLIHQPLWDAPRVHPDWEKIEGWLGVRPYTVFAGHIHAYTRHVRRDQRYLTLATTGGRSRLRGPVYGEFDHVAMVSMTEEGPVIANLMLDGIAGEEIRRAETRSTVRRLSRAVRAEPLVQEGRSFQRGVGRIELVNHGAAPLSVHGRVDPGPDLRTDLLDISVTVPANAAETVEVPLWAPRPVSFQRLGAARAQFTLEAADDTGEPISIESEVALVPEARFPCPKGPAVSVDGDLSDWGTLPFAPSRAALVERHGDTAGDGASFSFAVRHDEEHLYLGVRVLDDALVASEQRTAREQDGVTLVIDARPETERRANQDFWSALRGGSAAKMIFLDVGPATAMPDPVYGGFVPAPPEGAVSAVAPTEDGYAVEIAIPTAVLDAGHGSAWDGFRLQLGVRDFAPGVDGHTVAWWRPSRFGAAAIPGSGSFDRQD